MRFELLVAFNLAVQGLSYAFGGLGEPDFVWRQGQTDEAWLEVTRVSLDDFDRFRESLEDEAARRDVSLLFEVAAWPLTIRRQNHVFAEISRLIDATAIDGRERRIALPELGDGASVSCRPGPPDGLSRTTVHHAGFETTSQYRDSLADKLSRSIEIKDSQARRGEWQQATGLLIDISTARYGQLLSQEELASMLSASIDWRASPYAAVSICYSNLHGVGMWGVCKFRPDVDRAIRDALEPALLTMGLPAL